MTLHTSMEALNPSITPKPCLPTTSFLKPHLLNSTFKPTFSPHSSHFIKRTPLSLSVTCALKTPQENKNNKGSKISKKIILSEGAPPPLEEKGGGATGGDKGPAKSGSKMMSSIKRLPRKVLSVLSYLPLAIGEMFVIAGLMAIGTFIDQGEAPGPFNLAVAPLQINGDKKLYGAFLPVGDVDAPKVKGINQIASVANLNSEEKARYHSIQGYTSNDSLSRTEWRS